MKQVVRRAMSWILIFSFFFVALPVSSLAVATTSNTRKQYDDILARLDNVAPKDKASLRELQGLLTDLSGFLSADNYRWIIEAMLVLYEDAPTAYTPHDDDILTNLKLLLRNKAFLDDYATRQNLPKLDALIAYQSGRKAEAEGRLKDAAVYYLNSQLTDYLDRLTRDVFPKMYRQAASLEDAKKYADAAALYKFLADYVYNDSESRYQRVAELAKHTPSSKPTPALTSTPPPAETPIPVGSTINRWGVINSNNVNFRSTPSKANDNSFMKLSQGIHVWIYESMYNDANEVWTHVNLDGQDGYIMTKYIDIMTQVDSDAYQTTPPSPTHAFTSTNMHTPEPPYVFYDSGIERMVRDVLGKQTGTITRTDLMHVTNLDMEDYIDSWFGVGEGSIVIVWSGEPLSISSLRDLINFENLSSLSLFNLQEEAFSLSGVSVIRYLSNLSNLAFYGCNTDISQLSYLTNLTSLNLVCKCITDISPLSQLTNLKSLVLNRNQISDIRPLLNLTNLTSLNISNNYIWDILPLRSLTNLTSLDLSYNQIMDITPLSCLANLTSLDLSHNNIMDISTLSGLANLTSLGLLHNNTTDITSLGSLTNLTSLDLSYNTILDISPLGSLTNLTSLDLSYNTILDISPLGSLTNLTSLDLFSNYITVITPLYSLTNLTSLDLSYNTILDISPLGSMMNLTSLGLFHNSITDITPLSKLTKLSTLNLHDNSITDISSLSSLKSIIKIYLGGNPIKDYSPVDHLPVGVVTK